MFSKQFSKGYDLIEIEYDQVALAGTLPTSASNMIFYVILGIMMLLLAIVLVGIYYALCRQRLIRIEELSTQLGIDTDIYKGMNYRRLREECIRLESLVSEDMLDWMARA